MDETDIDYKMNIYIISDDYNPTEFQIISGKDDITQNWKIYHKKRNEKILVIDAYIDNLNEFKNNKNKDNVQNNLNEIFILQIKNEKDELIKSFFKDINQIIEPDENYLLPFVIFLVDEKYNDYIKIPENDDDEVDDDSDFSRFEQKKIFTFPFKQDIDTKIKFKNRLFKCCSYFHELGDLFELNNIPYNLCDINIFSGYINILLAGRSGAGKSTFINQIIGDYLAKEGGNFLSTSYKFTKYHIHNKPIIFIDSPGFEDLKITNDIIIKLKALNDSLFKENDQIHLILYFIDGGSENKFLNIEKDVLRTLITNPVPIIFIASHCENNPDSLDKNELKNYKIEYKKIKKTIINILEPENFEKLMNNNYKYITKEKENDEKYNNIILVNFLESRKSKYKIPAFGIDKIFDCMYNYLFNSSKELNDIINFTKQIKDNDLINRQALENQVEKMLKDNLFFHNMINLDEIEKNKEKKARSIIRYQTFYASTTGLFPIIDIASHYFIKKSLNKQIATVYGFNIENDTNKEKNENEEKNNDKNQDLKDNISQQIDKNTQSSSANAGKTIIGILLGTSGNYLLETAVINAKSLLGYGIRFASSIAFLGGQIALASGYGGYKMYSNGEEILNIYKEKYYEKKYESLINFINTFINAVNYLKIVSDGFKELYKENGIKKNIYEFDINIILSKYNEEEKEEYNTDIE